MKKIKHTPGPWSINNWPQPDSSIAIGATGTPLIARVQLRDVSINEHNANARLIAAAPELLEALSELADEVSDRFDLESPSTNPGIKHAVAVARKAIARATAAQA